MWPIQVIPGYRSLTVVEILLPNGEVLETERHNSSRRAELQWIQKGTSTWLILETTGYRSLTARESLLPNGVDWDLRRDNLTFLLR